MFSIPRTSQTGQFILSSDCFSPKQWQLFPKTFFPKQRQFSPKTRTLHNGNWLNRRVRHSYIYTFFSRILHRYKTLNYLTDRVWTILTFKHFSPKTLHQGNLLDRRVRHSYKTKIFPILECYKTEIYYTDRVWTTLIFKQKCFPILERQLIKQTGFGQS